MIFFALSLVASAIALLVALLLLRISRRPELGIYTFVFLSSNTMMPNLPVVGDRLIVADFVMLFTLLITALQGQFFRSAPTGLKLIDQVGLAFILVASFSSIIALIKGGDPVRVILFLLIYAYGYCCFRLILRLITTRAAVIRLLMAWAAGATLLTVVGFLASTGIYKPAWTFDPEIMRISSTMKKSGQVSSYLGPALFLLVYLGVTAELSTKQRLVALALVAASAVVLLGTGSRISFVILVFSILYCFIAVMITTGSDIRRGLLVFATVAGVAGFAAFALNVLSNNDEEYGLLTTSPFERALKMWSEQSANEEADLSDFGGSRYHEISVAFSNIENHLFIGTGSGMFGRTYRLNEIHNTYVSILAENGLISFVIFLFWVSLIFAVILKTSAMARGNDRLIMRLLIGAFLSLLIYQMTTNGMRQRPFWFVPAIALCVTAAIRRDSLATQQPQAPAKTPRHLHPKPKQLRL